MHKDDFKKHLDKALNKIMPKVDKLPHNARITGMVVRDVSGNRTTYPQGSSGKAEKTFVEGVQIRVDVKMHISEDSTGDQTSID